MKTVIFTDSTTTLNATDKQTAYVVGEDVTIDVLSGAGIEMSGEAKYRTLDVDGSVHGGVAAVRIGYQPAPFGGVKLNVGETGRLDGDNYGVIVNGQGHFVRNAGEITGGTNGIYASGTNHIVNTGDIHGNQTGLFFLGGIGEGVNLVVNRGTISGESYAIDAGTEYDKIVNFGKILGDVDLGARDDTFVFKAGTVVGTVSGEEGDDIYIVKKAGLAISEEFGEGVDVIRSSVTIEMPANIEELYLTGKNDINATGSSGGNWIYGNAGANRIDGGGGFDFISGGKGKDVLTGGASSDTFHFLQGSGKDVVTDFTVGFDEIDLSDLSGATSFADMLENHVQEKGDHLWISYGKDIVVLKNIAIDDLKAGDFDFV